MWAEGYQVLNDVVLVTTCSGRHRLWNECWNVCESRACDYDSVLTEFNGREWLWNVR